MSSQGLERRILALLLKGPKQYYEIKDVFVGAGENKVSNQTLENTLKRLEVEGTIKRRVREDGRVVYSLTSVLEEFTKTTFEGSLEVKIIAVLSIYLSLYSFAGAVFNLAFLFKGEVELLGITTIIIQVVLALSFLVGGLGLWNHRGWGWYMLMTASIGHLIALLSSGWAALTLLLPPHPWVLLLLVIAAYLWYRRDILRQRFSN